MSSRLDRLDPYSLVGTVFRDRYAIESFVGVGRFSAVYRGTETSTSRPVALRLLKVRSTLTPSQRTVVVERLRGLTHLLADVSSQCPTFAGVLEVGALITSGRWLPLIVQTWMDGETLESVQMTERQRDAPIRSLPRAIDLLTPVADALGYAHARGLVHGSLAPRNVFVGGMARDGWSTTEILDLGIAQALAAVQWRDQAFAEMDRNAPDADAPSPLFFFAPAYGSPEHFRGTLASLSAASDVFALALMTVEMVTGRSPLGDGDDDQLEKAAVDPARRPTPRAHGRDLGSYVEAVFERALAVRGVDRYASVSSFWEALRAASQMTTLRPSSSNRPPPLPTVLPLLPLDPVGPPPPPATLAPPDPRPRAVPREYSHIQDVAPRSVRESAPPPSARRSIPPEDFFGTTFPPSARDSFPSIPGTNPLFAGEPEAIEPSRRAKSP